MTAHAIPSSSPLLRDFPGSKCNANAVAVFLLFELSWEPKLTSNSKALVTLLLANQQERSVQKYGSTLVLS